MTHVSKAWRAGQKAKVMRYTVSDILRVRWLSKLATVYNLRRNSILVFEGALQMSLDDVLPDVQSLSRSDKLILIQVLAEQLAREESSSIESKRSYPIWSPHAAFKAADMMLEALAADESHS